MSKERELLERVSKLRKLRDIQGKKGNHDYDDYMRGLYNGLELALSLFEEEREPQYKNPLAHVTPVYTAPKREPLSADEIFNIGYNAGFTLDHVKDDVGSVYGFLNEYGYIDNNPYFKFVRAIEKEHGIGEKQNETY